MCSAGTVTCIPDTGAESSQFRIDVAEVIGAAVKEWLIDMGVDSSRKHKVAS